MKPLFLSLDEIIAIHDDQIARYGGSAGVRDWGLLQSAIAVPTASFGGQFLHHGIKLTAEQDEYADLVLSVARSEIDKAAIAEFLRKNSASR